MWHKLVSSVLILAPLQFLLASAGPATNQLVIKPNNPLIWYHGRWDEYDGSWWSGTGFKLNVQGLKSISLNVGPHTTSPYVAVGVSIDYAPYFTVNVTVGSNSLPLDASFASRPKDSTTVLRIAVENFEGPRMDLDSIVLNKEAKLLPYKPSKLSFQFIGDSLTAGYYNSLGAMSSYGFLLSQAYKAESNIVAQPGACLTDTLCWGHPHGMSYLYFKTEDGNFYFSQDHNYTTNWDFKQDYAPSHVFMNLGANDNHFLVSGPEFTQNYLNMLAKLRKLYPRQPIFILSSWGWPNPDGNVYDIWYDDQFPAIIQGRRDLGDKNVFLVNTTNWLTWADIDPSNWHENDIGHVHIAEKLGAWLKAWGLKPEKEWKTLPKK